MWRAEVVGTGEALSEGLDAGIVSSAEGFRSVIAVLVQVRFPSRRRKKDNSVSLILRLRSSELALTRAGPVLHL